MTVVMLPLYREPIQFRRDSRLREARWPARPSKSRVAADRGRGYFGITMLYSLAPLFTVVLIPDCPGLWNLAGNSTTFGTPGRLIEPVFQPKERALDEKIRRRRDREQEDYVLWEP